MLYWIVNKNNPAKIMKKLSNITLFFYHWDILFMLDQYTKIVDGFIPANHSVLQESYHQNSYDEIEEIP